MTGAWLSAKGLPRLPLSVNAPTTTVELETRRDDLRTDL